MATKNRVSLSDETLNQLTKIGKPFESVDDCLQRILDKDCVNKETQESTEEVQEE